MFDFGTISSLISAVAPVTQLSILGVLIAWLLKTKDITHKISIIDMRLQLYLERSLECEKDIKDIQDKLNSHYLLSQDEAMKFIHHHGTGCTTMTR